MVYTIDKTMPASGKFQKAAANKMFTNFTAAAF